MTTWQDVVDNNWRVLLPEGCKVETRHPGILLASKKACRDTVYKRHEGRKFVSDDDYFAIDFAKLNSPVPGFLQIIKKPKRTIKDILKILTDKFNMSNNMYLPGNIYVQFTSDDKFYLVCTYRQNQHLREIDSVQSNSNTIEQDVREILSSHLSYMKSEELSKHINQLHSLLNQ